MPSQSFSGKSKEDLVIVARLSGLLSDEEAKRMTRPALARFLEQAQAEADVAARRQETGLKTAPAAASTAAPAALAASAADGTAASDEAQAKTVRKPVTRKRKTGSEAMEEQPGLMDTPAAPAVAASAAEAPAVPAAEAPAAEALAVPAPAEAVAVSQDAADTAEPAEASGTRPAGRTRRTVARTARSAARTGQPAEMPVPEIAAAAGAITESPAPEIAAAKTAGAVPEAALPAAVVNVPAARPEIETAAPVSEAPVSENHVSAAPVSEAPVSEAPVSEAAAEAAPATRPGRRGGRRSTQVPPLLAIQPMPVDLQPAIAAETAAAAAPAAAPAELNALEPTEPTVAQAAAEAVQAKAAPQPQAAGPAAGVPAASPAELNAAEPLEPTVAQAAAARTALPAAPEAAGEPQHRRGRPPKANQPPQAPVAAAAPSVPSVPAAPAAPSIPAAPTSPAPARERTARPFPPAAAGEAGRQPIRTEVGHPVRPEGTLSAAAEPGVRQQQRDAGMPVRSTAPGQIAGRHERHVRIPGGSVPHHSIIPAHHTLTGTPEKAYLEAGEAQLQSQPEAAPQRPESTLARPEGFQERQPAGQQPSGASEQGRSQGQASQPRGPIYNASGKIVRPTGEGYAEIGEPGQAGEDVQPSAHPGQERHEGDAGKSRRAFVETGDMVSGVLEIMPDGYGFLRKENYLQGSKDIYVPPQYIRRFNLREGDLVTGPGKVQRESDRYQALLYIKEVNGMPPERMIRRPQFDKLTPIYPNERFVLETVRNELSTRIIDLVAPIGKGQRGMIVSPPKAGKTILLQKIANAISTNNPDVKLIVLLIDERPEEVTDMQRSINGEVVYSTFDKTPENHVKVTELVLERAMRLVELGQDVVILLDSITRMGRAYNLTINPTGRTLSGGLDPGALYGPKRFFGAARNIEGGGSLTIIATALIDTGSRMDEVIFEEFKGTGNMEVYLDRKLSEKRIFPAIDINRSGTRREELLLTAKELDAVWSIRKAFSQLDTAAVTEMIINLLMKTNNNQHFVSSINVSLNDKNIFEAMRGSRPGQSQNGHSSS